MKYNILVIALPSHHSLVVEITSSWITIGCEFSRIGFNTTLTPHGHSDVTSDRRSSGCRLACRGRVVVAWCECVAQSVATEADALNHGRMFIMLIMAELRNFLMIEKVRRGWMMLPAGPRDDSLTGYLPTNSNEMTNHHFGSCITCGERFLFCMSVCVKSNVQSCPYYTKLNLKKIKRLISQTAPSSSPPSPRPIS